MAWGGEVIGGERENTGLLPSDKGRMQMMTFNGKQPKSLQSNFSSKGASYNFFVKPDGQSEIYFDFAAARKSA